MSTNVYSLIIVDHIIVPSFVGNLPLSVTPRLVAKRLTRELASRVNFLYHTTTAYYTLRPTFMKHSAEISSNSVSQDSEPLFVLDHRESLTDDLPGNIGGCPPRYPELSSSYFEREIVWIAGLRARAREMGMEGLMEKGYQERGSR